MSATIGGVTGPMTDLELKILRESSWPVDSNPHHIVACLLATIADREESREAQWDAFHACINLYAPKDDFPDDPPAARLGKIIAARDAEIERLRAEVERTAQDGHISANDAIRAEARAEKAERERDEARAEIEQLTRERNESDAECEALQNDDAMMYRRAHDANDRTMKAERERDEAKLAAQITEASRRAMEIERDEARADRDAQRHSILNKGGRRCLCTAPKSNPHDEGSDGWHEHGWRFPDRRY